MQGDIMSKTNLMKKVKPAIFAILACFILLGLTSCNYSLYKTWNNYKDYTAGNGDFDATTVSSIAIDWVNGDINVVTADVEKITVFEQSARELKESELLRYYLSDGVLDIKFVAPRLKLLDKKVLDKDLFIQIPLSAAASLSSLNIDSVNSDINVKNIKALDLEMDVVSGKIDIKNCTIVMLDIESVSDEINLLSSKIASIDISCVSTNIKVNSEVTDFEVDTTSGNVDFTSTIMSNKIKINAISSVVNLTLPENSGFTVEYDTLSGQFTSDFATTNSNDKYIFGDGTKQIEVSTISGNLSILKL